MEIPVDLLRFSDQIRQIESHPIRSGKVMLYGSSFFAKWFYDRAQKQLSAASDGKLQIINHGFGGATVDELLYYYPRLVTPYSPSAIVIRSGYNDISRGLSPEQAMFLLKRLVGWINTDFPDAPVLLMKIFDVKRGDDSRFAANQHFNALLEEYAKTLENAAVLDINSFFYEKAEDMGDRSKLRDVFVDDGLHLTDSAYEEMAPYFAQRVLSALELIK